MELNYIVTAEDYKKFAGKMARPKIIKASLIVTAVIFATFLLMRNWKQLPGEAVGLNLFISAFYGGLLFLILNAKLAHNSKKNIRKTGPSYFDSEKSILLNEDAIIIKSTIRESKIPYDAIKRLQTDTEYIVIEFNAGDMVYVPIIRIKNPEILDDFLLLLKSAMAKL